MTISAANTNLNDDKAGSPAEVTWTTLDLFPVEILDMIVRELDIFSIKSLLFSSSVLRDLSLIIRDEDLKLERGEKPHFDVPGVRQMSFEAYGADTEIKRSTLIHLVEPHDWTEIVTRCEGFLFGPLAKNVFVYARDGTRTTRVSNGTVKGEYINYNKMLFAQDLAHRVPKVFISPLPDCYRRELFGERLGLQESKSKGRTPWPHEVSYRLGNHFRHSLKSLHLTVDTYYLQNLYLPNVEYLSIQFFGTCHMPIVDGLDAPMIRKLKIRFAGKMPYFKDFRVSYKQELGIKEFELMETNSLTHSSLFDATGFLRDGTTTVSDYRGSDLEFLGCFDSISLHGVPPFLLSEIIEVASENLKYLSWADTVDFRRIPRLVLSSRKTRNLPNLLHLSLFTCVTHASLPCIRAPNLTTLTVQVNAVGVHNVGRVLAAKGEAEGFDDTTPMNVTVVCAVPPDEDDCRVRLTNMDLDKLSRYPVEHLTLSGCTLGYDNVLLEHYQFLDGAIQKTLRSVDVLNIRRSSTWNPWTDPSVNELRVNWFSAMAPEKGPVELTVEQSVVKGDKPWESVSTRNNPDLDEPTAKATFRITSV